jgi:hypothetical protein
VAPGAGGGSEAPLVPTPVAVELVVRDVGGDPEADDTESLSSSS